MTKTSRPPAPVLHRALIWFLATVLTVLFYWALDFVASDIGNIDRPDREAVAEEVRDAALHDQLQALDDQRADLNTRKAGQLDIQRVLRESTGELRSTMDQLVALHELDIKAGVEPTEERQRALAESQTLYLAKQTEFQQANETIGKLSQELREAQASIDALEERRKDDEERVRDEYRARVDKRGLKVAGLKLAFLLPALAVGVWLVLRHRQKLYAAIFYAWFVACFLRVAAVMHEYLPGRWFRHIAVAAAIAVVIALLVQVVKLVAAPRRDLLLRRYREAYGRHRCPVCAYQIARGPLKHAMWTAKGPARAASDAGEDADAPYTCPSCGTGLYHECSECESVRHTLLPYCDSCGAEREATA
jgi:hypothetical protein